MKSILIIALLGVIRSWYDEANKQWYKKPNYQKIREAVFTDYNSDGWPSDGQVEVRVSLSVIALQLVSEITSSVIMKVALYLTWRDTRLQWDPKDYDDLS